MKKEIIRFLLILFGSLTGPCDAVDIGSDTGVERFNTQQTLDDGDRIAGFAGIDAGFALRGSFVTGTFDGLLPMTGRVDLNAGTLVLDKDLHLDQETDFSVLGNITGNNHRLDLSSSVTAISSLQDNVFQCRTFLIEEETSPEIIRAIDWSWDSKYIALGTDIVSTNSGLHIYEFDGTNATLLVSSTIADPVSLVNDVRWHPSQYVLALNRESGTGDEIFTFSFDPSTNELIQLSSDDLGNNGSAVAWHPMGSYLASGGARDTQELVIYPVDEEGILDTTGKLIKDTGVATRNVRPRTLDWNTTGDYLGVGYNSTGGNPELEVYGFTISPLALTLNASEILGAKTEGLDWSPTFSWILAVGVNGTGDNLQVFGHDNVPGNLTQLAGVVLEAQGWSPHWNPGGDCLAVGRSAIDSIAKFNTYSFDQSNSSLVLSTENDFTSLVRSVRWSLNGSWIATGNGINLRVFGLMPNHCSTFENVHINMEGPLSLNNCCIHFKGDCSINGGGNQLMLESTCRLTVDADSELRLTNMSLKGVTSNRLSMGANSSVLFFEDVRMKIVSKFKINQGSFRVLGTFRVSGDGKEFIYESNQQSFVKDQSELVLDENLTFSYDSMLPDRLTLNTDTSQLILAGATLHATSTGLELTNGILRVIDNSNLSSEVILEEEDLIDNGISLGNQIESEDIKVIIHSGIELACVEGSVRWKNVGSDILKMRSILSQFRFLTNTSLYVHEDMDVRPGRIVFDNLARLLLAPGKTIFGSINPLGVLSRGRFTP